MDEIQESMMGQLMMISTKNFVECFEQWKRCWENCVRSKVSTLKETKVSLSYVQCFLYLVSSSAEDSGLNLMSGHKVQISGLLRIKS